MIFILSRAPSCSITNNVVSPVIYNSSPPSNPSKKICAEDAKGIITAISLFLKVVMTITKLWRSLGACLQGLARQTKRYYYMSSWSCCGDKPRGACENQKENEIQWRFHIFTMLHQHTIVICCITGVKGKKQGSSSRDHYFWELFPSKSLFLLLSLKFNARQAGIIKLQHDVSLIPSLISAAPQISAALGCTQ